MALPALFGGFGQKNHFGLGIPIFIGGCAPLSVALRPYHHSRAGELVRDPEKWMPIAKLSLSTP